MVKFVYEFDPPNCFETNVTLSSKYSRYVSIRGVFQKTIPPLSCEMIHMLQHRINAQNSVYLNQWLQ